MSLVWAFGTGTALAGNSANPTDTSSSNASGDGSSYTVKVSYTHRGDGNGSQPAKYSGPFDPPVCWYTAMTPDQFHAELDRRYDDAGQNHEGTVYDYYNQVESDMNSIKYHQGDDGSWWVLTWDESRLNDPNAAMCAYQEGWLWRPPADPPAGHITPEMLARAAFGQLKLPSRGVTLSPVAQNQKVNIPTYVNFTQADGEVSVTAQVTEPNGQVVAATVVAQPTSLHVDAGTQYALPQSCDYDMTGAKLNSAGAGCNITYNRASHGTYPFTADMTWTVTWTPTAAPAPNGTRLQPDGFSESRQDVTVQEIQAINR
jgi:enoyl reductase